MQPISRWRESPRPSFHRLRTSPRLLWGCRRHLVCLFPIKPSHRFALAGRTEAHALRVRQTWTQSQILNTPSPSQSRTMYTPAASASPPGTLVRDGYWSTTLVTSRSNARRSALCLRSRAFSNKTIAPLQIRALYRARLLDKGSTVPAPYLSGRDTRPLPRIVGFCSPRTRGGREVDILRLGSPCGSDEDQGGPNHY